LSVISQWMLGKNEAVLFSVGSATMPMVDIICIFLLLGVVAKSAQIGLHT
jgi:NADH:ubiquinone oxidoreductase subunit 5 (subunit L)/multisubunit Na+/H+ antiporter MnhA subunit